MKPIFYNYYTILHIQVSRTHALILSQVSSVGGRHGAGRHGDQTVTCTALSLSLSLSPLWHSLGSDLPARVPGHVSTDSTENCDTQFYISYFRCLGLPIAQIGCNFWDTIFPTRTRTSEEESKFNFVLFLFCPAGFTCPSWTNIVLPGGFVIGKTFILVMLRDRWQTSIN